MYLIHSFVDRKLSCRGLEAYKVVDQLNIHSFFNLSGHVKRFAPELEKEPIQIMADFKHNSCTAGLDYFTLWLTVKNQLVAVISASQVSGGLYSYDLRLIA
jgi:hypothetical protein